MKLFYLFFILLPLQAFSQLGLIWTDTIVANKDLAFGNTRPRIVLANNDVPVISWGKATNQGVYASRLNGSAFGSAIKLTPNNMTAFVYDWAGPEMGSSGDTLFVAFKAQPENTGMIYLVRSINGGNSFSDTLRVSNDNWSRFPAVAVEKGGNPVVTFMKFDPNFIDGRYTVSTSGDGGDTFNNDVEASTMAPGEVCDCCPAFIGVEQDYIFTLYRNNDNNLRDIWASVSTNGGTSFDVSADIDNSNWTIGGCPSTGPDAILANDSLIAVWTSGATGSSRVYLGVMDKNTLNIGQNSILTPNVASTANQNYPKIAGNADTLGIVWQESHLGRTIVKFIYSVTGTTGLHNQEPDTVSVNLSGHQKNPDIEFSNGTFYFTWQDDNRKEVVYRSATLGILNGINKPEITTKYTVYPNPANSRINIDFTNGFHLNKVRVTLFDYTGRIVFEKNINTKNEIISTEQFSEGLYVLIIENENEIYHEKIILKR
ncbi:MAG: T9SS type A sorting domain-containing protein [Bacteroidota bacterium]|nr:T9SS type A sorting domain-containing protein [Bacteroidota bacterium]